MARANPAWGQKASAPDAAMVFSGIDNAEVQANKLGSGRSKVEIVSLKLFNNRYDDCLGIKVKVLESDNPLNKVGFKYELVIKPIFGHPDKTPGAQKRFLSLLAAAFKCDAQAPPPPEAEAESWEDLCIQAMDVETNPLEALEFWVEAEDKPAAEGKVAYVQYNKFLPV